jgi:hypothetical protein
MNMIFFCLAKQGKMEGKMEEKTDFFFVLLFHTNNADALY